MRFVVVCTSLLSFFMVLILFFRSDPDKETQGWGENDRGVSFTFGADVVAKVSKKVNSSNSIEILF
jgi:hypothetical protein